MEDLEESLRGIYREKVPSFQKRVDWLLNSDAMWGAPGVRTFIIAQQYRLTATGFQARG